MGNKPSTGGTPRPPAPPSREPESFEGTGLTTITESAQLLGGSGGITESSRSFVSSNDGSIVSCDDQASQSIASSSLHGNLMRTLRNRDPHKVFEVVKFLGEGSMGSVAKVKKRATAIGGSARPEFVKEHKRDPCCLPVFQFCLPKRGPKQDALFWTTKSSLQGRGSSEQDSDHSQHSAWSWSSFQDSSRPNSRNPTPAATPNPSIRNRRKLFKKTSSLLTHGSRKDVYYALKSIHLDRCSNYELQQELRNEVAILKQLDHPNIVRAIETFDYKGRLFIALELCDGGDLYTRDPYSEAMACRIIGCLASAIAYLHSKGIIHRDIKMENVMFVDDKRHSDIKIIDFGLSSKFAADEYLKDTVGTVYTMAPELLSGRYNEKADIWSLGILAFMLLSSSMPFYGKTRSHVIKKIARGKYRMTSRRWRNVSENAISFVQALLQVDPNSRPSADEVVKLPWIKTEQGYEERLAEVEMMDALAASIQSFTTYGTLKKLGLMVVAYKSTNDEVGFLRRMFKRFDSLQDGEITKDEFAEALIDYAYTQEEIDALYMAIDIDGTGSVHYIEFLAATLEALGNIDEERLAEAFDRIDSDDSGFITIENLRDFLGDEVPRESLEAIIDEADILQDHRISYQEFLELFATDTEEKIQHVKNQVKLRREFSQLSMSSLASSTIDELDSLDGEFDELGDETEVRDNRAEHFFEKQREVSLRGIWI